ncbi:hypothetical protein NPX13_g8389 [Xylaria arbuscula]|uniref:Myb-like domain-containing protein n=1 Tax=Xylaria arbuscula TaxID=114810 RepID=A0A9W8TIE5_9PEZI|nr:hypothetical protein NPX13_g8389 [Xylaria arbuscula]
MPEFKFRPLWEPPVQKQKTAGPAATQLSRQCLGLMQGPAQSSHLSQSSIKPVNSNQIDQIQGKFPELLSSSFSDLPILDYHTNISNINISGINVALSIPNGDMLVESAAISRGFGPLDITGSFRASSAIAQLDFPYDNASHIMDRSVIESEDCNSNASFDGEAQPMQMPISGPEYIAENLPDPEDCTTAADTDAALGALPSDLSSFSGARAGINAHLEGLSSSTRDGTSQSPNKDVSEPFINDNLRPERQLCKTSLTHNDSTRSHSAETSILSPGYTEKDLVDIGSLSSRENSLTVVSIASPPSEDHAPDHVAEGSTNVTLEECTQGNYYPTLSDYTTSQSGPGSTQARKRLTRANTCGSGNNETPEPKRPRHSKQPNQPSLRDCTPMRSVRSLPSCTVVHSGKSTPNDANSRLSRSSRASRRHLRNRPENTVSEKYRAKKLAVPDHDDGRGGSTYEVPVQPESPTSQKVGHSTFRAPSTHSQNLLGGRHPFNDPDPMLRKSPPFADSRPLAMQCNTCGFSAEHILQLSDYVQGRLQEGDDLSTIQLFLGFIRDYASQRRTYEKPTTAYDHAHDARVRGYISDSDHVSTPDTSEHDGGNNTSDTDTSGEDSDNSRSCQSESPKSGITMSKKRRWEPLEEARLRAWAMEKKEWSWIAKKLRRSPGAVSQHWGFMLKQDVESAEA